MKELKKPLKKASTFVSIYPWMLDMFKDNYTLYLFAFIHYMTMKKNEYVWVSRKDLYGDNVVTDKLAVLLGIPLAKLDKALAYLLLNGYVIGEHDEDYNYYSVNEALLKEMGVA